MRNISSSGQVIKKDITVVVKKASISGIGDIFLTVCRYTITVFITRLYGPVFWGIFVIALVLLKVAQVFSNMGLNQGVLRYVSFYMGRSEHAKVKGVFYSGTLISFALSIAIGFVLYLTAGYIAGTIFHEPEVEPALKLLIVALPFWVVSKIWMSCLQGFKEIKVWVYLEKILQPLLWLLFLIIFYFWKMSPSSGIVLSLVASYVLVFLLTAYYLNRTWPMNFSAIKSETDSKQLVRFSMPLFFTDVMALLLLWTDVLMLGYFRPASEVGIYEAAVKMTTLIVIPLNAFNSIFAPIISEYYSLQLWDRLKKMFKIVTKWIVTISLPLCLMLIIYAEPVMNIYGKEFIAGVPVLVILALGQLINVSTGSVGYILTMTERQNIHFINSLILLMTNVALNIVLIPEYHMTGAAIATGVSIALVNIMRLVEIYVLFKMHPYRIDYFKTISAGLIAAGSCFLLVRYVIEKPISIVELMAMTILFILFYAGGIYIFKLEEEDDYILTAIKRRIGI